MSPSIGDARQRSRLVTGGDDDLARGQRPGVWRPSPRPGRAPARRPVPLIQSILFFLKRNSTPFVQAGDDRVLARVHAGHVDGGLAPAPNVMPHSAACCASLSACACSSSALVGMQPQLRQVPPSTGCAFDDGCFQAELSGADGRDVAARAGADDDDVVRVRPR